MSPSITEIMTGKAPEAKPATETEPKDQVVTDVKPDDVPKEEPKGRTVKYNKADKFVPEEEVDTWVQKGLHHDVVQDKLNQTQASLLRAAKVNGFDKVEDYMASLDTKENEVVRANLEDAYGDPDKMDAAIRQHPLIRQAAEQAAKTVRDTAKASLKGQPFYAELETELDKVMDANPGVDPDIAYDFLIGKLVRDGKMNELVAKAKEEAKLQATAELHDQARRGTPKGLGAPAAEQKPIPTGESKKIKQAFGLIK